MIKEGNLPFSIVNNQNGTTTYTAVDATPEQIRQKQKELKEGDTLISTFGQHASRR